MKKKILSGFVLTAVLAVGFLLSSTQIVRAISTIESCNGSTFDSSTTGSVNGKEGWTVTGPYDQAVVDNNYGFSTLGCKTFRISNAITSGGFGDQTFTASNPNESGETSAVNGGMSGGTRQNHFESQFNIASTTPNVVQPGLKISVSPDRGDGSRMSYLRFEDQINGIHVFFDDVTDSGPLPTVANFNEVDIATLDRTATHTVKFSLDLLDGAHNDIAKIYIDGNLVHTGTTWEDYYRFDPEQTGGGNLVPTVDSLIIRSGGAAVASNSGKGFLFDNFNSTSTTPVPPTPAPTGGQGLVTNPPANNPPANNPPANNPPASNPVVTPTGSGQVLGASTGPVEGCGTRTTGFSTTSGQSCVGNTGTSNVIPGCENRTTGFSTTSGQSCVGNTGTVFSSAYHFTLSLSINHPPYPRDPAYRAEVMELQKFLNLHGFGPLDVDGMFGPLTNAAVIKFQLANGLVGDGIVGPNTRAKLNQ